MLPEMKVETLAYTFHTAGEYRRQLQNCTKLSKMSKKNYFHSYNGGATIILLTVLNLLRYRPVLLWC